MPNGARRQMRPATVPPLDELVSEGQDFSDAVDQQAGFADDEEMLDEELDGAEGPEDQIDAGGSATNIPPPPPSGLKEISSLANWTVSSSKPGCSVAALRAPTTSLFWQSDGPQPHHLNIHFFKMVAIAGMRIYLDFDLDESYTPTLIRFAAGTGYNDLQEFSTMRFDQPKGWIDVDWEGVGDPVGEGDDTAQAPILRCMLVQVRICENHQNGKDTHLRGLQIFARDSVKGSAKLQPAEKSLKPSEQTFQLASRTRKMLDPSGWLDEPILR